ncbi:MAG: hypothetical protein JSS27_18905 [Planctomycetes bacterium]|nr:hypothetical protein [Planctomycetota bacterium]
MTKKRKDASFPGYNLQMDVEFFHETLAILNGLDCRASHSAAGGGFQSLWLRQRLRLLRNHVERRFRGLRLAWRTAGLVASLSLPGDGLSQTDLQGLDDFELISRARASFELDRKLSERCLVSALKEARRMGIDLRKLMRESRRIG